MSIVDRLREFSQDNKQQDDFGFTDYVKDIGSGLIGGAVDTVNETIALKDVFSDEEPKRYLPKIETKTKAGAVANFLSQITLGVFGAGKVVKAAKFAAALPKIARVSKAAKAAGAISKSGAQDELRFIGNAVRTDRSRKALAASSGAKERFAEGLVEGALVDFTLFSDNEDRLSDLIESVPALQNPITEYLASDPNDSVAERRFKNALEGLFTGAAVGGIFYSTKLARAYRAKDEAGVIDALEKGSEVLEEGASKNGVQDELRYIGDEVRTDRSRNPLAASSGETVELTRDEIRDFGSKLKESETYDYQSFIKSTLPEKYKQTVDSYANELMKDINYYMSIGQKDASDLFQLALGSNKRMAKFIDETNDNKLITLFTEAVHSKIAPKLSSTPQEAKRTIERLSDLNLIDPNNKKAVLTLQGDAEVMKELDKRLSLYRMQSAVLSHKLISLLEKRLSGEVVEGFEDFFYGFDRQVGNTQEIVSGLGRGLQSLNRKADAETIKKIIKTQEDKVIKQLDESDRIKDRVNYLADEQGKAERRVITENHIKAMNLMLQNGADPNSIKDMSGILAMMKADENVAIRALADMGKKEYAGKSIWSLFINGLLSSPATQVFNTVSSALKLTVSPAARIIGGAMTGDISSIKQGARMYAAYSSVFCDSIKMAKAALIEGRSIISPDLTMPAITRKRITEDAQMMLKREMGVDKLPPHMETVTKAMGFFGSLLQSPTRLMGASDEFFKQMAYRSKVYADAVEEAAIRNVPDKAAYAQSIIEKSMYGGKALNEEARRYALSTTWNQELKDEGLINNLAINLSKTTLMRPFAPFIKTPTNLIHDIIAHSPLAPFSKEFRKAAAAGGPALAEAEGKIALGQMFTFSALALAAEDRITGAYPKDPESKAAWQAAGRLPYSFKIGDTYIPYNRLDPFGAFFGVAADLYDLSVRSEGESQEENNIALELLTSVIKGMMSKTYVTGLADAFDVLSDPDSKKAGFVIQNLAQGLVPFSAGLRFAARQIDPSMKETDDIFSKLGAGIPIASNNVPDRYSWITGKAIDSSYFWSNGTDDKVLTEITKYGDQIESVKPTKQIYGMPLDAKQYSELSRLNGTVKVNGRTMYEELEALINSRRYQNADDNLKDYRGVTERGRLVGEVMRRYRKAATDIFISKGGLPLSTFPPNRLQAQHPRASPAMSRSALTGGALDISNL